MKEEEVDMERDLGDTTSYITTNIELLNRNNTYESVIEPNDRESRESESSDEVVQTATGEHNEEDVEYPEGGVDAWLVILGSFLGLVADFGLPNSVGSIQAYISTNQLANVSNASSSWVFAVFASVAYLGGIFGGILFDEFGTKIPMLIGMGLFVPGLLGTANSQTVVQFTMCFGLITGLGMSICMVPLVGVISHWFCKKRARATGFASLGGSVGGIIFPIMLRSLYDKVGFVWAIRVLTLVCFTCMVVAFVLIKERLSEPRQFNSTVSNERFVKRLQFGLLNAWVYTKNTVDFAALKDPKFFFCVLATLLSEVSLMNTVTYFGSYALAVGVSQTNAYLMMTVINLAGILGRAVPGILADKYGPYNVSCVMIGMVGILELVIWFAFGQHEKALWAFTVLYGIFSASVLSLTPVCCGAICDTRDFGRRYATNYVFTGLATLACVPIAGAIIGDGSMSNYKNYILFTALMGVAGDVCWATARYFIVGKKLWVIV